jgi:hypothetical protein
MSLKRRDRRHTGGDAADWRSDPLVCERDAGGRCAEWELARAAEYGREVTLALIGVDVTADDGDAHVYLALMRGLDDVVLPA